MPESSELIFDLGWDLVLRTVRERYATMSVVEADEALGDDVDFRKFATQILLGEKDVPRRGEPGFSDFDTYGFYETVGIILHPINEQLGEIHKRLIEERFGETYMGDIGAEKPGSDPRFGTDPSWYSYVCAVTPEGPRAFSRFSIDRYGYEMAEDDEMNWGIGLTSRYIPVWIDWRYAHGGSGEFRLNSEALEMIEQARAAIADVIPEIKDADLMNTANFY